MGPDDRISRKVLWSKGDRILVSAGIRSKDQAVFVTDDDATASASFTIEDPGKTLDFSSGVFAAYPSSGMFIGMPDPQEDIIITVPGVQNYVEDSFDDQVMPMISDVAYGPELKFRNIASVLRLNLSSAIGELKIKSIIVSSKDTISGEFGYLPATDTYIVDSLLTVGNTVCLECGDGVAVADSPVPFNIVIPHRSYSDMSFTVKTVDGMQKVFDMKPGKVLDVKRGTILDIPLCINALGESQEAMVDLEVMSVSCDSFEILLDLQNVDSYFCGLSTKSAFTSDYESGTLLTLLNYMQPYTSPLSYSGPVVKLQESLEDVLIEPGQKYVFWVVPYKSYGSYSASDVTFVEAETDTFKPGGFNLVTVDDEFFDYTTISFTVSSFGAKYIYCMLASDEFISKYPTVQDKIDYMISPGSQATVYSTSKEQFVRKFLRPNTKWTFLALAITRDYKYGQLYASEYRTKALPYNDLSIAIDKDISLLRNNNLVRWNVTGGDAESFRYIIKDTGNHLWTNTFEKSVEYAQEQMYLNPSIYYINNTTSSEAVLSGLEAGKEYVMIVTAVDADGNISVADSWFFEY